MKEVINRFKLQKTNSNIKNQIMSKQYQKIAK